MIRIPPRQYAGTERVVAALGEGLHRRGHQVTLFASGDSEVPYDLVPLVPRALWEVGEYAQPEARLAATVELVAARADQFDLIHSHLDTSGLPLTDLTSVPILTTVHARLDVDSKPACLRAYPHAPLVAISASQRRWFPENNWVATIHHGLPFGTTPDPSGGDYLLVVGRATREKGVAEAIELARRTRRPLVVAAKAQDPTELRFVSDVIQPAVERGGVEFVGEVSSVERDRLIAGAFATLMLGAWPEPFGLVAIESMAVGTPVVARRAGALPELIEHGRDGFLVDDLDEALFALELVPGLNRAALKARTRERFSVDRMVEAYEAVYARLASGSPSAGAWKHRGDPGGARAVDSRAHSP
jgi:glycosyltransferase involved in cell wall biosynthesis